MSLISLPPSIQIPTGARSLNLRLKAWVDCQGMILLNGRNVHDLRCHRELNPTPIEATKTVALNTIVSPNRSTVVTVLFAQFRGYHQGVEVEGSLQFDGAPPIPFKYMTDPGVNVDPGITHVMTSEMR